MTDQLSCHISQNNFIERTLMNIRDEEQLQQYFERGMTSAQEQNFLINVAARDDMRLAFRSQLELLKAVREDKDASGSPTFIRSKTLTALGLGGALMPSSLKEQEAQTATLAPSILEKIGTAFKRPAISIATGLIAGVLGTSFFIGQSAQEKYQPASTSSPVIQAPVMQQAPQTIAPTEAVPAPVENRANRSHGTNRAVMTTTKNQSATNHTPIINQTKPGPIGVDNKIHKPEDPGQK
jgi:hypothetical protein